MDVLGAFVGFYRLQVGHVAEDGVFIRYAVAAQDVTPHVRARQRHPDVVTLQHRDEPGLSLHASRPLVLPDLAVVFVQRGIIGNLSAANLFKHPTPTSEPHQLSNTDLLDLPDQCFTR